jgi:hypothetical protein
VSTLPQPSAHRTYTLHPTRTRVFCLRLPHFVRRQRVAGAPLTSRACFERWSRPPASAHQPYFTPHSHTNTTLALPSLRSLQFSSSLRSFLSNGNTTGDADTVVNPSLYRHPALCTCGARPAAKFGEVGTITLDIDISDGGRLYMKLQDKLTD